MRLKALTKVRKFTRIQETEFENLIKIRVYQR